MGIRFDLLGRRPNTNRNRPKIENDLLPQKILIPNPAGLKHKHVGNVPIALRQPNKLLPCHEPDLALLAGPALPDNKRVPGLKDRGGGVPDKPGVPAGQQRLVYRGRVGPGPPALRGRGCR